MDGGSGAWRILRRGSCLAAVAAIGWSATGFAALPAPEELVPNTVVRIAEVPERLGTVTRAEFRHALVLATAGGGRPPKPGDPARERLERVALIGLVEAVWLKGQAAEMDIALTRRQVLRELERIKEENFRSGAEFREFLRETRFTRRDLYERVELQMLAMKIQERVLAGAQTEAEEKAAFRQFVDEFNERWRARTVCAPEHAIAHCSNGPEPAS
ncbi:MAG TPA: hypothetical protein VEQ41_08290 [Solirubrobacterales bacterium]|nr:hypothetical protein [Solirubrobacterales bacterium]